MKKRVLSCLIAALTMSSVFAFRVSAVTVERDNPLSVSLPKQAEQIVEEALEGKTDAAECVYFAPYHPYANGCIEMVTVLTPEQTYGLKTKAQENIVTVYMQPTTYATFVVYSKIDCTERLEALAGDIGEVQCLRSEEAPAQPGIAETTSSTPHTDSDGTVYPYTFTLTFLHSDASESDKALWAYTTYNALMEAADNAPKFEVWTDHGSLGTEVGHYVLPAVFGDVDGDGEVTVKDAQAALMAAGDAMAGLDSSLVSEQLTIADVDGDGEVTVKDAQYILIYADNTNSEIACTWRSITGNPDAPDESNL